MTGTLSVRRLDRTEAETRFDELARLRITVFREFPYLYDGDADYERRYLSTYFASPQAVVIGALDGERLVGAATAAPLALHAAEFAQPFAEAGLDPSAFYYFGESILEPPWRGRGIGVRFFEEREQVARDFGFNACVFCAVRRPPTHPARPDSYLPLDGFWRRRGYRRIEGLSTEFSWREIGEPRESPKPMDFWMRPLAD